jgi:predicted dehydrogenase
MHKIGIVGMGGMGWFHAGRYLQLDTARIAAIADVIPERLDAQERVEINLSDGTDPFDFSAVARYEDGRALIAEADVDVVDICLPTHLHAPYAVAALEAGHHVLCEKPMALSVEDADRMIAAARAAGRRLMIAQCIRFWPEYLYLREQIEQGAFGRLLSLNMWRMGGRPGWSPDNWFLDPARSGGAILDLHIHDVDYANAVFGEPDTVYATGRQSEAARTYDVIHAVFAYADGPQVHMHAGWSTAQIPFQAGFEAWFDRALVRYDADTLRVYTDPDGATAIEPDLESGDGYLNEIAYFLDCIERDVPPTVCTPASTRDSLALIQRELDAMEAQNQ